MALQRIGAIISHEVLDHRATNVAMAQLHQMMIEAGPDVLQVGAIDADGLMLWSSLPMPATPVDLSKTEHFTSIAVDGRDTFIGRPVIGHLTHQWTVQMSYAVRGDDRALQAVVVVSELCPVSRTLGLSRVCDPLEFHRAEIANGRVPSARVVEAFDIIEHIGPCLVACAVDLAGHTLGFQR